MTITVPAEEVAPNRAWRCSIASRVTSPASVLSPSSRTPRQPFDRDRAKESQHIERVFVLQPFGLSFSAPIGKLMQLGHE